jgi:tetratricopeptide (TPR) repeat protein
MWVKSDPFGALTNGLQYIQMLFFANVAMLAGNLWPRVIFLPLGRGPSDGLQLLHTLRNDPKKMAVSHASWFAGEGALCFAKRQYGAARSWFEKGLCLYPADVQLVLWNGKTLLALKEFRKALEAYDALLPQVQNDRPVRALVLNNLAYAGLLLNERDRLPQADGYSDEAISTLGWSPAIKGTRGAVLLEMGKVEEAMPLLREAMQSRQDPADDAQSACWLAIAEARKGDLTSSRSLLEQATKLDANCILLERAQSAVRAAVDPRVSTT